MTVSATQPFDLYINNLSAQDQVYIEPSEFTYIAGVKQQTYAKISSDMFPSLNKFAAKVRINGISHYTNQYL